MKANISLAVLAFSVLIMLTACTGTNYINTFEEPSDIIIPEDFFSEYTVISSDSDRQETNTDTIISDEIIDTSEQSVDVFATTSDSTDVIETYIDDQTTSVWIPTSGKKYHKTPGCSNMKSPSNVSLSEAKDLGYEPCKRCYKQ